MLLLRTFSCFFSSVAVWSMVFCYHHIRTDEGVLFFSARGFSITLQDGKPFDGRTCLAAVHMKPIKPGLVGNRLPLTCGWDTKKKLPKFSLVTDFSLGFSVLLWWLEISENYSGDPLIPFLDFPCPSPLSTNTSQIILLKAHWLRRRTLLLGSGRN